MLMQCYVMLCCYVLFCSAMSCYVMLCYVTLRYVMLCYVTENESDILHRMQSCHVMLCHVLTHLNAVVFDPQIFVRSPTWITKHRVAGKKTAARFVVAFALHSRNRICSMTIGGLNSRMRARMTVTSAIGRLQHVDFSSTWAT